MGYRDVGCNNPYAGVRTGHRSIGPERYPFYGCPFCGALSGPSRYGLVTGRYFFRTPKKSEYWGYLSPYIEPERLTIGSLMRNAGYTTACVGKWHLGLDWRLKDDSKPQILTPKKFGYTNTDFSAPVKKRPYGVRV